MITSATGSASSFGPVRQIQAGPLSVGYVESGPAEGPAVVLLHGWPYDIHSYAGVVPLLTSAGYRTVVPYLRGFGSTGFLSRDTFRNAQQSALALDVINLMDALAIESATIAGYDWGARTANIVAALWPERCRALVSVGRYLVTNLRANTLPVSPREEWVWWYQHYFVSDDGRTDYEQNRYTFARIIWRSCSPNWQFDEATFERTALAFSNADHVRIAVHNYRWRFALAPGEAQFEPLEDKLRHGLVITVPCITIATDVDGATGERDAERSRKCFQGRYSHRVLRGVGHNVPQEAPHAFAKAILDVDRA